MIFNSFFLLLSFQHFLYLINITLHVCVSVWVPFSGKPWILLIPSNVCRNSTLTPPLSTCGLPPELSFLRSGDSFSVPLSFCSWLLSEMTHRLVVCSLPSWTGSFLNIFITFKKSLKLPWDGIASSRDTPVPCPSPQPGTWDDLS